MSAMWKRRRVLLWAGLLVVLAVAGLVGVYWLLEGSSRVTLEALEQVEAGMTVTKVELLLGNSAKESPNPYPADMVARLLAEKDLVTGKSLYTPVKSGDREYLKMNRVEGSNWKIWQGPQRSPPSPLVTATLWVAVRFDAQGYAIGAEACEVTENASLLDRLRRRLGF
jgi:hypothetical protein